MADKSPYVMMGKGPMNPVPPPKQPAVKFLPGANQKGFPSAESKESKGTASKEQMDNRSPAPKTPVVGKSTESSEMPGSGSSKKSKEFAKAKICNWLVIVFVVLFILALAGAITMTILFALKTTQTECIVEIDILKVLQMKVDPTSRTASDEEMALACMMYESSTKCCLTKAHLEKTMPKIPENSAGKTGFQLLAGLKKQSEVAGTTPDTSPASPASTVQPQQQPLPRKQQSPPSPPSINLAQVHNNHPSGPSYPSVGVVHPQQPNPSWNSNPLPNPPQQIPSSSGNLPFSGNNPNINRQNHISHGIVPGAISSSSQGGSISVVQPSVSESKNIEPADEETTTETTEEAIIAKRSQKMVARGKLDVI